MGLRVVELMPKAAFIVDTIIESSSKMTAIKDV